MQFQYLKQEHFRADHCMMLNRWIEVDEAEMLLVALISRDDRDILYYMYRDKPKENFEKGDAKPHQECSCGESWEMPRTRREALIQSRCREEESFHRALKSISLLGQTLQLESSGGSRFDTYNFQNLMALQYFFERGIDLERWNEIDIATDSIILYACVLSERFAYVTSHFKTTDSIEITFDRYTVIQPFDEVIEVSMQLEQKEPIEVPYFEPVTGEPHVLYLNAVSTYDIWDEANSPFKGEWLNGIPEEAVSRMKIDFLRNNEGICPRGMVLALLEYETDEDVQLTIKEGSVLDEVIDYTGRSSSSASAMFFSPDTPIGPHGRKNWIALLKPVVKGSGEALRIEIWDRIQWMPETSYISIKAE